MFSKTKNSISIQASIAIGLSLFIVLLMIIIGIDTKKVADRVIETRIAIDAQVKQSREITRLREEAESAGPKLTVLEDVLPPKDELFTFPSEITEIGSANNVTAGFTFGNEGDGTINYNISARGTYGNVTEFVEALRDQIPFMNITSFDLVQGEGEYNMNLAGSVFFDDEKE